MVNAKWDGLVKIERPAGLGSVEMSGEQWLGLYDNRGKDGQDRNNLLLLLADIFEDAEKLDEVFEQGLTAESILKRGSCIAGMMKAMQVVAEREVEIAHLRDLKQQRPIQT
jgi:hypothetical protein